MRMQIYFIKLKSLLFNSYYSFNNQIYIYLKELTITLLILIAYLAIVSVSTICTQIMSVKIEFLIFIVVIKCHI